MRASKLAFPTTQAPIFSIVSRFGVVQLDLEKSLNLCLDAGQLELVNGVSEESALMLT